MDWQKTNHPGIYVRHEKACASHKGGRCRCQRSWRVRYRDARGPKWSRTFKIEAEARNWRRDGVAAKTPEALSSKPGRLFNDLAAEWFALAESGAVPQKGGRPYSKGTLMTYKRMYNSHVRGDLGKRAAAKLTGKDWQLWLDGRVRFGLKRNSVSVTLNVVRSIYRWACAPTRGLLILNATRGLELPAHDETPRDRVATPDEAKNLLAALRSFDRTAYGLSLYAGLRNVERRHLEWTDLDLATGKVRVRVTKGEGGAGIRTLPIVAPLRVIIREEHLRQGRPASGLVCRGPKGGAPDYDSQVTRAKEAWTAAGVTPIGFHECRHTFISTMIASGLNAKAVSVLAGHASITVTYDRYGHLFAGHEDEAGTRLDAFYGSKPAAVTNAVTNEATEGSESAAVEPNRL